MPTVKFGDLREAFDFVSFGSPYENNAYIERETGEIILESELTEDADDLPDDLGDPERYIVIPHKNELDLGRRLVLKFAAAELSSDLEAIEDMFKDRGAYPRFKALLEQRGKLETWYAYEEDATCTALREWSAEAEIDLVTASEAPPSD